MRGWWLMWLGRLGYGCRYYRNITHPCRLRMDFTRDFTGAPPNTKGITCVFVHNWDLAAIDASSISNDVPLPLRSAEYARLQARLSPKAPIHPAASHPRSEVWTFR